VSGRGKKAMEGGGVEGKVHHMLAFLAGRQLSSTDEFQQAPMSRPSSHVHSPATYHVTHPAAIPCTESLAAWVKLLPCRTYTALGALLREALPVVAAPYHSLGLHLSVVDRGSEGWNSSCGSDSGGGKAGGQEVHVRLTLTLLLKAGATVEAAAAADAAAAGDNATLHGFVESMLGWGLEAPCPAAAVSKAYIARSAGRGNLEGRRGQGGGSGLCLLGCSEVATRWGAWESCDLHDLHAGTEADARSQERCSSSSSSSSGGKAPAPPPPLAQQELEVVSVVIPGSAGHSRLSVAVRIASQVGGRHAPSLLHLMQIVPWQLPLHDAPLRLTANGTEIALHDAPSVVWHRVQRAQRGQRPATIELLLRLPPAAEIALSMAFRKEFLTVFQHAPDPSRCVWWVGGCAGLASWAGRCVHADISSLVSVERGRGSGWCALPGFTAAPFRHALALMGQLCHAAMHAQLHSVLHTHLQGGGHPGGCGHHGPCLLRRPPSLPLPAPYPALFLRPPGCPDAPSCCAPARLRRTAGVRHPAPRPPCHPRCQHALQRHHLH
jgi:hypothetical protein